MTSRLDVFSLLLVFTTTACSKSSKLPFDGNETKMRGAILGHVPIGASVSAAQTFLVGQGFNCAHRTDWFTARYGTYLYCDVQKDESFLVTRRWQLAFWNDGKNVTDLSVTSGLTGP